MQSVKNIDSLSFVWYNNCMGLIKWIKSFFKKTIAIKDINSNYLVAIEKNNEKFKFGTDLEVAPNFVCALVYKNKVADIFTEGRYRLDTSNMPLLSRLQKLTKPNKKGELPKYFKADIYYINLKVFENESFQSLNDIVIRDKNYKHAHCKLCGKFSYQVISPVDFMEAMFMRYGVLRDGVAKNELSCWIAEISTKFVQKKNLSVESLYSRDSVCFENIIEKLNKELFDVGVKILSFEITDVIFPKKIYKKIELSFSEINRDDNTPQQSVLTTDNQMQNKSNLEIEEDNNQSVNQLNELYQEKNQKNESDVFEMPTINNFQNQEKEYNVETDIKTNLDFSNYNAIDQKDFVYTNKDIDNNIDSDDYVIQQNNQNNQFNGVADEIEKEDSAPIKKTIKYKKCSNCGAFNSNSAETCFACGHKFAK